MNLTEAMKFIHSTDWKGSCLGLDRMQELMNRLGDPQKNLKFVHVTGTNGKGSTCAMLASILAAAGFRTGLYTSPHLLRLNERININGADISDSSLISMAEQVKKASDAMEEKPTEFEIITAMAFCYFRQQACDIVVLEVGLGGRLDATNIIPVPEIVVITNIGLEHTEILGGTLEKIAFEKSGIIKEGCLALTYQVSPEVEDVYRRVCAKKRVPLRVVRFENAIMRHACFSGQAFDWENQKNIHIQLLGQHQIYNAVMAMETIEALREKGWKISGSAVRAGLEETKWPARFEALSVRPPFILDGAHNPQCVKALIQNVRLFFLDRRVTFLIGVLADKDYKQMLEMLLPYAESFVCITPDSPRALKAELLARCISQYGLEATACESVEKGIKMALFQSAGSPIIACGSLYMMGELRRKFPEVLNEQQNNKMDFLSFYKIPKCSSSRLAQFNKT